MGWREDFRENLRVVRPSSLPGGRRCTLGVAPGGLPKAASSGPMRADRPEAGHFLNALDGSGRADDQPLRSMERTIRSSDTSQSRPATSGFAWGAVCPGFRLA